MEYLLLALLSIIIYTEILPTLSIFFEFIRTWFASKITIIQQYTVHMQEDIQNTQTRMEPSTTHAIGFKASTQDIEEYEEDE